MAFWKKQDCSTQTFADLVRGLQHSVNAAMEMLEARNIELLGRYFDEEGNATTRRLLIDKETAIDIPIISIVNPSAMNIKEVEMQFDVQIDSAELKRKAAQDGFKRGDMQSVFDTGVNRSSLEVSFGAKKDHSTMNVKIKFESTPIPEGLSRTIDEYDKTILPKIITTKNS
ncbi:MAG: DUF2589 domain-containing protein [Prevotellaceae bacterium]|jgi:hypothetical protein|nr:DUF2589 domain-containing protein [Prevotellaceae bacterium]